MSEKPNSPFEKARDEALRALVLHGGLTPDQVSALKLNQVHLATSTLVIKPDEFASPSAADERPVNLKLDETMQRTLIAWLVVRPDSSNDHLFPGTGLEGLDVATIDQVTAAERPAEPPQPEDTVDTAPPSRAESEKSVEAPPESPPRRTYKVADRDSPPAPPPPAAKHRAEPQAVPLDEIESLRERLAEAYDAWAPAVTSPPVSPAAEPAPETEVPSPPPSEDVIEPEMLWEPEAPPPEEDELEAIGAPLPRPKETLPVPIPSPGGASGRLKELWESGAKKFTLNLSYRAVAIGGLALLAVVVCCLGLTVAGRTMLGVGGLADLLAGATPPATEAPTEMAPSATSTPSPTPTVTATSNPTVIPSPTFTVLPAPTDIPAPPPTLGPTPTPVVIVVTATPTPEPPSTATPVPTNTPVGGTPAEATATPTPAFKYPAPVLLEPEDGGVATGMINILKWEPVGPLADDEWYAVRLIFRQQGEPVYEGDWVKYPEWRIPDRFYYQADGPTLEYRWFVFVERENADGSATQISPESETSVFRWE